MIFRQKSLLRLTITRTLFALLFLIPLVLSLYLLFQLIDDQHPRTPLSYKDAHEQYHYYYSAATAKKVALTFDDGPNAKYTLAIAEEFKARNVPATFFFIGEYVLVHPDIARKVAEMGFEIGNHSFTHMWSVHNSKNRLAHELSATSYLIELTTGTSPRYYRPPYLLGIGIDPAPNPYIPPIAPVSWSLDLGYVPVGTDIDPRDWVATSSASVIQNMLDTPEGKNMHIVLMHDVKPTAEAIGEVIDSLQARGYTLVTLDELITPPDKVLLPATLRSGDTDRGTGGAVSALQWFLYTQGDLDAYALSGIFDEQTKQALGRFQIKAGILDPTDLDPATFGIADERTRVAIESYAPHALPKVAEPVSTEIEFGFVRFLSVLISVAVFVVFLAFVLVLARLYFMGALLSFGVVKGALSKKKKTDLSLSSGVSVVIPAWNEEANIGATLKSIIGNRRVIKDIIVVDDGSTDRTAAIVRDIITKHPHEAITLISTENGGKAKALNTGVAEARGDIIVTMDGDAIFTPTTIEALVAHFADPTVGAVAGKVYTARLDTFFDQMQALEYMLGQNIDKRALAHVNAVGVVPGPIGAWRRQDIIAAGGFSADTLVEDQDMTLMILRAGKRVVYEPRAVAYTETPQTIRNFLKQRFRWIYGTMQCFWKHSRALLVSKNKSPGPFFALLNVAIFNVLLPLMYPIVDIVLIVGLLTGSYIVLVPVVLFTVFDCVYAYVGTMKEEHQWRLLLTVPVVRIVYRQLISYTVAKSIVRSFEGTGLAWDKVKKTGEAERLYASAFAEPAPVVISN
jgi:cellulose synthase/poly-beta-1,6-N-acetylglucosamine synthase-like glycosyltransferase/peptidoglycan/xylan/chitin deacetylase (PgdA/CDA1 family)